MKDNQQLQGEEGWEKLPSENIKKDLDLNGL